MAQTLRFTVEVRREVLLNLLTTAVAQGSGYWAEFDQVKREDNGDGHIRRVRVKESDGKISKVVAAEDLTIGLERLARCMARGHHKNGRSFPAAGKHLADALSQAGDMYTADVVLQMTVFDELVYG